MMQIVRDNIIGVFILLLALILSVLFYSLTEVVTVTGTVVEHNVLSNRHGNAYYYTIVRYEDGFESEEGLEYYMIPVGGKVTVKKRRLK